MKKTLLLSALMIFTSITQRIQAQCSTEILTSYGSVGAMYIYNTGLAIGGLADGLECKAYDSTYVRVQITVQNATLNMVIESYEKVIDTKTLSADDEKAIKELLVSCKLFSEEIEAFMTCLIDPTTSNKNIFKKKREKAWKKVEEIFGMNEDK